MNSSKKSFLPMTKKRKEELLNSLQNFIKKSKYASHIKSVALFGSYAQGKPTKKSDIDLLIEFTDNTMDLFDLIELENDISNALQRKIDLVTKDSISKYMQQKVIQNSISLLF